MSKLFRSLPFLLFPLLLWGGSAFGEPPARNFHLKDGSVVSGRLVAIEEGGYRIQSPTLGEIRIKEGDLLSMTSPGAAPAISASGPAGDQSFGAQVQSVQSQILGNPALMQEIQALGNNPKIQAVFNDPALFAALMSGNLQAIQDNPKIQQLLQDPELLRLARAIAAGAPQP